MSTPDIGNSRNSSVKTLAIRLEPTLHAQLSLIAQLRGSTITDEIRSAIEAHLDTVKANPDLASKADNALDNIERDAAARRDAIATLFGSSEEATAGTSRPPGRKPSGKATSES